jgi:hypothetical protein
MWHGVWAPLLPIQRVESDPFLSGNPALVQSTLYNNNILTVFEYKNTLCHKNKMPINIQAFFLTKNLKIIYIIYLQNVLLLFKPFLQMLVVKVIPLRGIFGG